MRILIIFILIFILTESSRSQLISIKEDSISFEDLIYKIELQSACKFFYSSEWVNNLYLNVDFNSLEIKKVTEWISEKSNLRFAFHGHNRIVFFKNVEIRTNYAKVYADYLKNRTFSSVDSFSYEIIQDKEEKNNKTGEEYLIYSIGNPNEAKNNTIAILSGKIRDQETGESLIGAVLFIEELKKGTTSDAFGFYSIALPKGQYKIEFRMIGMKTTYRNILILSDGQLNVDMKSIPTSLKEVLVTGKKEDPVRNLRLGMEKVDIKTLKQLPMAMGEPDVIKSTGLLPGVQTVSEASGGFNVRGGSTDQNLILFNNIPIMNTSHFFGFFSGFNSETIKDITLYKNSIPAKYGGRVSSVLDVILKDGNRKNLRINGGISPVFSRLTIETPIKKDTSSLILGVRTTYSDWLLKLLKDGKLNNSKANFYDLQGNFSTDLNMNNALYLSFYTSADRFDYFSEEAIDYKTIAGSLKWKHIFNHKLFSTFSAIQSTYQYKLESKEDSTTFHSTEYKLSQTILNADFSFLSSRNHKIDFGLSSILYLLSPGTRKPTLEQSVISYKTLEKEQGIEAALYLSDELEITNYFSVSLGIRYSFYSNLGPKTQINYYPGIIDSETIKDTSYFRKGVPVSFYSGPEFRLSSNIRLSGSSSIKIGYNTMFQYIHMISNTITMSPTDTWKLSDKYLKPQAADQFSIGFYSKLRKNTLDYSMETYYKRLRNNLVYKGGAQLMMNEHIETEILSSIGKAYGFEIMLNKKNGRLTGWMNYTYSKILHQTKNAKEEEKVNNGDFFPASYDKPHDVKIIANYKTNRRLNFSINILYSTGRPFTPPVAYYYFEGSQKVYYTDRNSMRMPDYFRLDLSATINGNLLEKKLNHSSWTLAVYNVSGRKNAHNIFFRTENNKVNGYKMSIFGRPVYTITYNFRIRGNAKDDF